MTSMEELLSAVKREALVEMVKLAQKRGMKGSKGGWKDFLNFFDRKIGASISDPSRRPNDALLAFLKTFTLENDVKLFENVLRCHSNRESSEQIQKTSPDNELPEQKLVRSTLEHPMYPVDYSFPSHEEGWLVTKQRKKFKTKTPVKMVAVDCEMVLCEDGTEALVRVCVVDRSLKVKLNEFVKPEKAVRDYRTEITGVAAEDLDGVTCSLGDVQGSVKKLLSHGAILVGHGLNNDLRVLKIDHSRVIDTSYIFKYGDGSSGRRFSLTNLCKSVLGYELREKGAPHSCVDDACAAMKLVLAKIEQGVENAFPLAMTDVYELDMAKLLVHRIPFNVQTEDLHDIIPGEFTVEVKVSRKAHGQKYSAFAIFKSQEEANRAFEVLEGSMDKDSCGRPQKMVSFQLKSGTTGTLCVCKTTPDSVSQMSRKRPLQDEGGFDETRKLRRGEEGEKVALMAETSPEPDQCEGHLKEIERLKQELSQRDQEISSLNKIIVALTRKQGL